ncbi:hypothetical protein LQV63_16195 [Paenibacillus profundus]|uniref:Uncharacterized protein n=1 Tax=Paenibacillus profundus TaxID=1173085 RepID=A0ABS8YJU2_9BACL|nr:hypothetical protein [Paenibacillus profundus]MCE5170845.1 hypothetical protein [Paenibacillus profundus]
MNKKALSMFLVSILAFLIIPAPFSFAYPDGLLNGKEMDTINSTGTKIGVTSNITDGDLTSSEVLAANNNSSQQNGLSFTFLEAKTITAYQLKSEITTSENRNRLVFEFHDTSDEIIESFTIPTYTGHKTYLENPINGVKKVVIRNGSDTGFTTVFEFELFDDPNPEPTYLGGLLDHKPLTISNTYGVNLGTTTDVTDGQTSTLFSIENNDRNSNVDKTKKSQINYEFAEPTEINAFQVKADISLDPYFDLAALSLEFLDNNNTIIRTISFPNFYGQKIYLDSPLPEVKKVILKSGTYLANTPVREFNVFGSEVPPEKPENPDPTPKGERAILVVTMSTGLEKEFDLSMEEVNAFITWYENKQSGTGTASYAINKHNNNKGPFSSRKDYVIFDKILTFEVSEYSIK